jgi:micrococcal nuclease
MGSLCTSASDNHLNVPWGEAQPFVPPIQSGCVIKVYDGDTITITQRMPYKNSPIYRFQVRLLGIDTPEMKSNVAHEKEMAVQAQMALSNLLLHKHVTLSNVSTDKYGRLLADVYVNGVNVCAWMLKHTCAQPYDGGKKSCWNAPSPMRF